MIRRLAMVLAAGALLIGATIGIASVTASAGTGGIQYTIQTGGNPNSLTTLGTVTLTNNDPVTGDITLNFDPASLGVDGGFVCVGDNNAANTGESYFSPGTGFTARVNPGSDSSGCTTGQYFVFEPPTGGTFNANPWVLTGIPASFFTDGMYLQIHVNAPNGQTAFACWQPGPSSSGSNSFYGNCSDPATSTQVPVGTIGGLGAAVVAGGSLAYLQRKRFRALVSRKPNAA